MVLKTNEQALQEDMVLGLLAQGAGRRAVMTLTGCREDRVVALRNRLARYRARQRLGQ